MAKKGGSSKKKSGVEAKMKDLLDMEMPMISVIYGRPGSGKTTIAGTYPKPILFLDIKDKGTESCKRPGLERGDITVFEIDHFDEFEEILEYIEDHPTKFKTVVVDHYTAAQEKSHEKVKLETGKSKMTQPMYGTSSGYMKEMISNYKETLTELGIEPVFLVQAKTTSGDSESGDSGEELIPEVGPALMASISTFLCAAARIIGHTYLYENVEKTSDMKVKRTVEYRLRLGPNPYYITKVTRPVGAPCPQYLVDASYDDIKKIVEGKYKEPKAKSAKTKKRRKK